MAVTRKLISSLPTRGLACYTTQCNPHFAQMKLRTDVSEEQVSQMRDELCVLVDDNDHVTGHATKEGCHQRGVDGSTLLHRAFSVFLFNSNNELLLQQRSSAKVTFPDFYTNSCCSHPRYNKEEMENRGFMGIKLAAQRRLNFELGISPEQVNMKFRGCKKISLVILLSIKV